MKKILGILVVMLVVMCSCNTALDSSITSSLTDHQLGKIMSEYPDFGDIYDDVQKDIFEMTQAKRVKIKDVTYKDIIEYDILMNKDSAKCAQLFISIHDQFLQNHKELKYRMDSCSIEDSIFFNQNFYQNNYQYVREVHEAYCCRLYIENLFKDDLNNKYELLEEYDLIEINELNKINSKFGLIREYNLY